MPQLDIKFNVEQSLFLHYYINKMYFKNDAQLDYKNSWQPSDPFIFSNEYEAKKHLTNLTPVLTNTPVFDLLMEEVNAYYAKTSDFFENYSLTELSQNKIYSPEYIKIYEIPNKTLKDAIKIVSGLKSKSLFGVLWVDENGNIKNLLHPLIAIKLTISDDCLDMPGRLLVYEQITDFTDYEIDFDWTKYFEILKRMIYNRIIKSKTKILKYPVSPNGYTFNNFILTLYKHSQPEEYDIEFLTSEQTYPNTQNDVSLILALQTQNTNLKYPNYGVCLLNGVLKSNPLGSNISPILSPNIQYNFNQDSIICTGNFSKYSIQGLNVLGNSNLMSPYHTNIHFPGFIDFINQSIQFSQRIYNESDLFN